MLVPTKKPNRFIQLNKLLNESSNEDVGSLEKTQKAQEGCSLDMNHQSAGRSGAQTKKNSSEIKEAPTFQQSSSILADDVGQAHIYALSSSNFAMDKSSKALLNQQVNASHKPSPLGSNSRTTKSR